MTKIHNITWREHPKNPLIQPPFPSPVIADPSVLTPDESPDRKWHLFAHSIFGVHQYLSDDGIRWQKRPGIASFLSVRPSVFKETGTYYLFYEKLKKVYKFPYYDSHIEVRESSDLVHWSSPKMILEPTLPWHKSPPSSGTTSNPFVVKIDGTYLLHYSAGLMRIPDTLFNEPAATGIAKAKQILGPYRFDPNPISRTEKLDERASPSANRVYPQGGNNTLGLQTYLYLDGDHKSRAALRLLKSTDNKKWAVVTDPLVAPKKGWKKSHVYVGDLKKYQGEYRIYFNARDGWRWGIERIGLLIGKLVS